MPLLHKRFERYATYRMSQLNFFLSQDEIASNLQAIFDSGEFLVFQGKAFDTQMPEPITHIKQAVGFKSLTLWLKNSSKAPIASRNGNSDLKGKFLFDNLKDPIIEIEKCTYSTKLISPGRVHFKNGWIEDDTLRTLHQKAGRKVIRLFDKHAMTVQKLWRVSEAVKDWVLQGGELELGINGFRINKENINVA